MKNWRAPAPARWWAIDPSRRPRWSARPPTRCRRPTSSPRIPSTWCCSTSALCPGWTACSSPRGCASRPEPPRDRLRHRSSPRMPNTRCRPRGRGGRLPHRRSSASACGLPWQSSVAQRPAAAWRARRTARLAARVLVVSDRGCVMRVPVAEVLYLKAELKYVTLRTANHSYVLDDSLAELESRLGERFLRVHRNGWWRAPRCVHSNAAPWKASATTRAAKAGRCAWRRWTNGLPCRAASSLRCARRSWLQADEGHGPAPHLVRPAAFALGACSPPC